MPKRPPGVQSNRGLDPGSSPANNSSMRFRAAPHLILLCGLVLALPADWCCLIACPKVPTTQAQSAKTTCRGCCCAKPAKSPFRPAPLPKRSCCIPTLLLPPASVHPLPPDVQAILPPCIALEGGSMLHTWLDLDVHSPSFCRALQLLLCVWLC